MKITAIIQRAIRTAVMSFLITTVGIYSCTSNGALAKNQCASFAMPRVATTTSIS